MKFFNTNNLPNILTVLRLVLTVGFYFLLTRAGLGYAVAAFAVFVVAAVTDFCDGYLAKKRNLITPFGKIMDPIADKFLILCAFYVFTRLEVIAAWMFILILVREVSVTLFRLKAVLAKKYLAAEKMGKYKTTLQMGSIILILIYLVAVKSGTAVPFALPFLRGLMVLTVVLTLASGASSFIITAPFSRHSAA